MVIVFSGGSAIRVEVLDSVCPVAKSVDNVDRAGPEMEVVLKEVTFVLNASGGEGGPVGRPERLVCWETLVSSGLISPEVADASVSAVAIAAGLAVEASVLLSEK